jgi:hypothetical protein
LRKSLQHFYDGQIARISGQVRRVFSFFEVREIGEDGVPYFRKVPVVEGRQSRLVAALKKYNSQNTTLPLPLISVYLDSAMRFARDRTMSPRHVQTIQVSEKRFNPETGMYEVSRGNRIAIQRISPIPVDLTYVVQIATSNVDTKFQILEQILPLFNPSFDLQLTENPLDWTSQLFMTMEEDITLFERAVEMGPEESYEITTLRFLVQAWINPPALVERQNFIRTALINAHVKNDFSDIYNEMFWDNAERVQNSVSVSTMGIRLAPRQVTLVSPFNVLTNSQNEPFSWASVLETYPGNLNSESRLRVRPHSNLTIEGRVSPVPGSPNILSFVPDQENFPTPTLPPVLKIIDGRVHYPEMDNFPNYPIGTRLISSTMIPEGAAAWGSLSFPPGSILELGTSGWFVSQYGDETLLGHILINEDDGEPYIFSIDGWRHLYAMFYGPGEWELINI